MTWKKSQPDTSLSQMPMVKIGLISDTHGYIDEKALAHLQDVDEIWHAGDIGNESVIHSLPQDKTLRAVYGNIDDMEMRISYPEELLFEIQGVRIMMVHIGGSPPGYAKGIKKKIQTFKPNLFVCGHSHICKVVFDKEVDMLYMNPGALGIQGFHQVRTLLKFDIEKGKTKNLRVVELGKKGK